MSHFINMFKSSSKFKTYLLQVGEHDAMAIYRLDADGKPEDMVSGKLRDCWLCPAIEPGKPVLFKKINDPADVWSWGFLRRNWKLPPWESVRQSMVDKSCMAKWHNQAVFDLWHGMEGNPLDLIFDGHYRDDDFALAKLAADSDREWITRNNPQEPTP